MANRPYIFVYKDPWIPPTFWYQQAIVYFDLKVTPCWSPGHFFGWQMVGKMLGMGGPLIIKPIYTRKNWVFIGFQNPLLKGSNSGLDSLTMRKRAVFFMALVFFCREIFGIHDGWSFAGGVFFFFCRGNFETFGWDIYSIDINPWWLKFFIPISMMVEFWLNVWGWWHPFWEIEGSFFFAKNILLVNNGALVGSIFCWS